MTPRAVLFSNGLISNAMAARRLIQPGDFIIAVDGGTYHALSLGLTPAVIIGDMDSLAADTLAQVQASGSKLIQYPPDKNETDLELAIQFALQQGYQQIIVVAALGGRLDQTLGNITLLADPHLAHVDIRLDDGVESAFFIRDQAAITGDPGDVVSLIPWAGPVTGVSTEDLRWSLDDETLEHHRTRGISNEMLGQRAVVRIHSGLLLLIHRRTLVR